MNRLFRTAAYQRFGIYRAHEELVRRGIRRPSEQIAALACFLEQGLAKETNLSFIHEGNETVYARVETILRETLDKFASSLGNYLKPLNVLALEVQPFLAWDAFQDFSELLTMECGSAYTRVVAKLRRRFAVGVFDVGDLSDQFVASALPRAVRSFDLNEGRGGEAKWLETVFYRHCLKRTLADLQAKRQLKELLSALKEESRDTETEGPDLGPLELQGALDRMPEIERKAVELYYGLFRREHTLAEVARALSCTEYHARAAVLRGLTRLSGIFHARGTLDEEEYELVQSYFGEGKHLEAAAAELHLEPDEARRVLARSQAKFAQVLRIRTSPERIHFETKPENEKKEIDMPDLPESRVLDTPEIIVELRKLKEIPVIKTDVEGYHKVLLDKGWVHVSRVRHVLREQPNILHELEEKDVPLDWLVLPEPVLERADTPEDRAYLQDLFEALAHRTYDQARYITARWLEAVEEKKLRPPEGDFDAAVGSVLRVLGGISQFLEAELPRELRRRGVARFRVDRRKEGFFGQWEGAEATAAFDLYKLALHRASLLGDFEGEHAEELAHVVFDTLFEDDRGTAVLPGFRIAEITKKTLWIEWRSPSLVESIRD